MANVGGNGKRLGVVFLTHLDGEWLAEDFIPSGAEHIEERLIGERQLAGFVAPDDRFVLRVEERAIAHLVLAQFPLRILQAFQTPLDASAHALDTISAKVRRGREREVNGDEGETNSEREENLQCNERARQQ